MLLLTSFLSKILPVVSFDLCSFLLLFRVFKKASPNGKVIFSFVFIFKGQQPYSDNKVLM